MNEIEKIRVPHKILLGASPKEADLAITSIDNSGTAGRLNLYVLKEYLYSIQQLPGKEQLRSGFGQLSEEGKKPILFVVTVNHNEKTEKNLEKNLLNTLTEFRGWFYDKTVWIPLMGTGDGGLTLVQSYSILARVLNSIESFFSYNVTFIISIPKDNDGEKLFSLLNDQTSEKIIIGKMEIGNFLSQFKNSFFLAGSVWNGIDDQADRFYKTGIWEHEKEDKNIEAVNSVEKGDIIILKSTFAKGNVSYLKIKGIGRVTENPKTGSTLTVLWEVKNLNIDIERLGKFRYTFFQPDIKDLEIILTALWKINEVRSFLLSPTNLISKISIESPDLKKILGNINAGKNKNYWWFNANPDYWEITDLKIGEKHSYSTHSENGNPRRIFTHFFEARVGDFAIGYESKRSRKIIALFEITKEAVNKSGDELEFRIIHFFEHQTTWAELSLLPLFQQTELYKNSTGSLFKLTNDQFREIIATSGIRLSDSEDAPENNTTPEENKYQTNQLKKANINNDGAQNDIDLLGFENDIRAFASLIALKDLKPPLAIALFGKWGSGKSFFMYNLQKRIEYLSINQGFEKLVEENADTKETEEPFCKGVVHITFNVWSYMDANLWASLVANIFEKLDEYIVGNKKADIEKNKIREELNKNLSFVSEEKNRKLEEKKTLVNEKIGLIEKIKELEKNKESLLQQNIDQKYSDLYEKIKQETPVDKTIKNELDKYGITEQRILELSPNNLFDEVRSWGNFFINLLTFSKGYVFLLVVCAAMFFITLFNPGDIIANITNYVNEKTIYFFSIVGPVFVRIYTTLNKWKKIYRPIKDYRDKFNLELEKAEENHKQELETINAQILQKSEEITLKSTELDTLSDNIKQIEYELEHSITKRAFFDFIKNKSKDEKYNQSLSIITTIRRDFEILSDLFRECNIPANISDEERKKLEEKKVKSDKFKKLFEKPLDRIVLYIDDLDRCPEDRVIEVLEAVNLLMAFPLFVVVVGVDPRWVKNALIKKYTLQFTGILNSSDQLEKHGVEPIQVTDYLEKIFQIPFHLIEATPGGIDNLMDNLFNGQIEKESEKIISEKKTEEQDQKGEELQQISTEMQPEKLPYQEGDTTVQFIQSINLNEQKKLVRFTPKDLKISKQELENIKDMAWLIGNNPRSLKRYANMYRIIRAHENLSYNTNSEQKDFLAVLFLLGLAIGKYKTSSGTFYQICSTGAENNFENLINNLRAEDKSLKEKIKLVEIPDNLKLINGADFNRYIPLVKRFSFKNLEIIND